MPCCKTVTQAVGVLLLLSMGLILFSLANTTFTSPVLQRLEGKRSADCYQQLNTGRWKKTLKHAAPR